MPDFLLVKCSRNQNDKHQAASADLVNSLPFQTAVKSVVNPQRKLDRVTRHHSFTRWNSRHGCEQYKIAKHNTDASGNIV